MAARVALGCAILFPEGCSEMTPFEQHLQALADLWNQGGKAYLTAQQSLFTGMADTMAKASSVGDKATFQAFAPDTKAFEAAQQDFSKLWSSASELSAALTKNLQGADRENPHVANMLAKIFDPRSRFSATNEVDQTLQRMAEGRRLADLWKVERKFIAVFNEWPCAGTASSTTKSCPRVCQDAE
jgi:poly[(R)-3-hydroxyalkanoate] polymerase subunit PhaE